MLDPQQFYEYILHPTLIRLSTAVRPEIHDTPRSLSGYGSCVQVLGTLLSESGLTYVHQLGGGPALGLGQMEPFTHDDMWKTWEPLATDTRLRRFVEGLVPNEYGYHDYGSHPPAELLMTNLDYAIVMTRLRYYRVRWPMPLGRDAYESAEYWKLHYNTPGGKGTVHEKVTHFRRAMEICK